MGHGGDRGDKACTEATVAELPWPVQTWLSVLVSDEVTGQGEAIFFPSANPA